MAAGVLEQLPQFLGAAASFMLGWACCDWLKTRQARKGAAEGAEDRIESSAGEAEPLNAGVEDVTKVNNSISEETPQPSQHCHAVSMDATDPEEGQQAVAPDAIVEYSPPEPEQAPEEVDRADGQSPPEPEYQDEPVPRDSSVRVLDTLIAVDTAD